VLGQNNKRYDGESSQGANQQRQNKKNLFLTLMNERIQTEEQTGARFCFWMIPATGAQIHVV
jgi:hypothetical protein